MLSTLGVEQSRQMLLGFEWARPSSNPGIELLCIMPCTLCELQVVKLSPQQLSTSSVCTTPGTHSAICQSGSYASLWATGYHGASASK